MSDVFVWFHNDSKAPESTVRFYTALLGWQPAEGPGGLPFFAGSAGPIAEVREASGAQQGWVPYAQVDDVDAATRRALELGAQVVSEKTRGPAGEYTIVRDPGGSCLALWEKA